MIYSSSLLPQIIECLAGGGVVIFPTETVMALACDATNLAAIEKIYRLKKRDGKKPLAVLMADIDRAMQQVEVVPQWLELINRYSPGPVSYVLPIKANSNIRPEISDAHTLSIRIPDHPIALEILRAYPRPLVGTSVNFSGEKSALRYDDIPEAIRDEVNFIITGGEPLSGVASTIVDLSSDQLKILRQGAIFL